MKKVTLIAEFETDDFKSLFDNFEEALKNFIKTTKVKSITYSKLKDEKGNDYICREYNKKCVNDEYKNWAANCMNLVI